MAFKTMEKTRIQAVANKALIAADPHYHAWTASRQEIFRATMDGAAQHRVEAFILNELLGIECTADNAGEIWNELPLSKLDNLNWAKLLATGIGDDMIMLNESMAEDSSLLDFDTLYDYDYDNHLFQEAANKEEFKGCQSWDYYALRFPRWARLIINERFYYATLYSLSGYLIDKLEDAGREQIRQLIPYQYIEGKEHGKYEKGGFLWDWKIDAAGQERQLDELKSRWYQYTQQRWQEFSEKFVHSGAAVYIEDKNENDEFHRNFVFNNESALKRIRWRHFLADCETIKADFADVSDLQQGEVASAEHWLQEAYQDVVKNFNPDVVKFKKKRKIVIAPGAFDGLTRDDSSE